MTKMYPTTWAASRSSIVRLVGWLAGLLLSACGSPQGSALATAAVPWTDRPGVSLLELASSASANRACLAHDIHVEIGLVGAYQGHQTQELFVGNVAPDACWVTAPPAMAIAFSDGRQVAVGRGKSMSVIGASRGVDGLAPRAKVHVLIGTPGTCAGAGTLPKVATVVRLKLSQTEVVAVSGTWINAECGDPELLAFDLQQAAVPNVPASSLRASLIIPHSTSPGGTLIYLVTLSNPTATAIALDPCPSYTESIGLRAPVRQTFQLNCSAVGSIPAGTSVTFEMRLAVPINFPKGTTKLSWQLEVPNGTLVGTPVTIT